MSVFIPPLNDLEKQAKTHAILMTTGFLILLPLGVLGARYARTYNDRWFTAHWFIQLVVSAPVIFVGWSKGYDTTETLGLGHFIDPHEKMGLTLLILYVIQLVFGMVIHFVKCPTLFRGHRPPQNYFHVFLGLVILVIAASQVHYGLYIEWDLALGGAHHVPDSAKHAWLALIIVFWVLYFLGLNLVPRQYKKEKIAREDGQRDHIALRGSPDKAQA
ncbi:hypothetical protein BDZ94DRAFT_1284930 [Collybia nuda]|uniref:Cytochrome b561 domain-containing protein n=1 Tax=Collybia nuda TaxID=64659 RepID=A0A9P5XUY5_9AGAR|nr:hypothetical protein BDZ94DRAFT_1284930 [Collybia nuda]